MHSFFSATKAFRGIDVETIARRVGEFRDVYLQSPITMNTGGANLPSGLNLFLMASSPDPGLIVESGVWKRQSSLFPAAACPQGEVHAFHPILREVTRRSSSVTYHEHDWMSLEIRCRPRSKGPCFFDDHRNQAERNLQAHERGFKYVIVDDTWPIETIIGCGKRVLERAPPRPGPHLAILCQSRLIFFGRDAVTHG